MIKQAGGFLDLRPALPFCVNRRTEVDRHGDRSCPYFLRPSSASTLDSGQRVGVVLVVAVADVEPAGGVTHRTERAAEDCGQRLDLGVRALRDPAEGGLQADSPV